MRLFKKKAKKLQRDELHDIPVGSMVELSDTTTFALEEKTSQTYEMKEYKKYEGNGFLRYMYHLVSSDDEAILGVDVNSALGEYSLARFVIDSEEEFSDPLGDTIVMDFDNPENEGETVSVEYVRKSITNTNLIIVTSEGREEYEDVEIQDYLADDDTLLMVELWDSIFTFFLGESIETASVNVYPMAEKE